MDKTKPLLRGYFHQGAFFIALVAGIILVFVSKDSTSRIISFVYSLSLASMFACSSLYHRINWSVQARMWWRRLDHSAIFFLIAGTGTPISLLGLKGESGMRLLLVFWIMAVAGIFKELVWVKAPKWLSAVFYVLMGWAAAPYLQEMNAALGSSSTNLLLAGGIVYTIGAVIYAVKKPDPWPKILGYHEIFHALVIVASALHFIVVYRLIIA